MVSDGFVNLVISNRSSVISKILSVVNGKRIKEKPFDAPCLLRTGWKVKLVLRDR